MRKIIRNIDRRFRFSRPGSVMILVVALLVLMALIGTAFLSTSRVDRYATVQHTNNTEIDLFLEGVKNMATATIVGSLNDSSLPFAYRPANSTIAKNWDAYDLYHQYTTDSLIGTTPNDAWLSPRCPTALQNSGTQNGGVPIVVWQCLGEPLTGNTFESPFVEDSSGNLKGNVPFTYSDRITGSVNYGLGSGTAPVIVTGFAPPPAGSTTPAAGNLLTPTFVSISNPDGTTSTFPAFTLAVTVNGTTANYTYLAGDADGDGIADCGMWKLPVGQINGVSYYAGCRIIDNCAAVNVNTAVSKRYDFNANGIPTRFMTVTSPPPTVSATNYAGVYNLGCFQSNVGLAELLESYNATATNNGTGNLGTEFAAWLTYQLGNQTAPIGGVMPSAGTAPSAFPFDDYGVQRMDFAFTTIGDLLGSQLERRPGNPGLVASNTQSQAATDSDAAALVYHFVFNNPNAARTPLETYLHNSLYDSAPNGTTGPPERPYITNGYLLPSFGATSYVGTPANATTIVSGWYADNFDWSDDLSVVDTHGVPITEGCMTMDGATAVNAGQNFRPRRSIFTADSAVSNLTPQPQLPVVANTPPRPYTTVPAGMSTITSTLCKASINTASYGDLWRAFWLAMSADNGQSPLGTNSGTSYDHDLAPGQSIYTGSQFTNPPPADPTNAMSDPSQLSSDFITPATDPQHPQEMFRSSLRNPTNPYYQTGTYTYIEPDQMVVLRSAIAAANATAMRYPTKGSSAPVFAYDVPLGATVRGAASTVYARVYGVTQQPYITEVYANTNIDSSADTGPTNGLTNTVPYIAVELFNPYNTPINLAGWQLAKVDRSPTSDTNRNMSGASVIYTFPATDPVTGAVTILQPYTYAPTGNSTASYQGSYALLENLGSGGSSYRPASTNLPPAGPLPARPGAVATGGPLIDLSIPALSQLIPVAGSSPANQQQELVLLRPVGATNTAESPMDQVPVDSFDFTGLTYKGSDSVGHTADEWHYVRGNTLTGDSNSNSLWRFIYPGRYDASDPTPYRDPNGTVAAPTAAPTPAPIANSRNVLANPAYVTFSRRQQGTQASHWHPADTLNPTNALTPFAHHPASPPITLGATASGTAVLGEGPNDNPLSSYPVTFPFQYLNSDQPGPSALQVSPAIANFPFGQFARNSDMLQVPFVGSYIVFSAAPSTAASGLGASPLTATDLGNIIEINPMPIDCSFAEDTDLTDDPPKTDSQPSNVSPYTWNECVGHFVPVNTTLADNQIRALSNTSLTNVNQTIADSDSTLGQTYTEGGVVDPYVAYKVQNLSYGHTEGTAGASRTSDLNSGAPSAEKYWRYHWASRIFDYLTVQNPNDDYFPNVQQSIYTTVTGNTIPLPVQNTLSTPAANTTLVPSGTSGTVNPISANPNAEDAVPVYGLININTAPWRVLSALRICSFDEAETDAVGNPLAAQFTISSTATPRTAHSLADAPDNTQLAQQIVSWRDLGPYLASATSSNVSAQVSTTPPGGGTYPYGLYKGPFTSLDDVLNVPAVQSYLYGTNQYTLPLVPAVANIVDNQKQSPQPNAVQGHMSPFDFYTTTTGVNSAVPPVPLTNGVRNDADERFDLLHRLSNQCTVKSDVYTVYIVIQGWRNAGSTSAANPPQMVTQRRAAFILDRTGVTPTNSNVKIINVPTN